MKNEVQKLVKGVIYDDPSIADDFASGSAKLLSEITDSFDQFKDTYSDLGSKTNPDGNRTLTPEEATICFSTLAIAYPKGPYSAEKNFIIPSAMIDEKLYNQLGKIDISNKILDKYLDYRDEIAEGENENNNDTIIVGEIINPITGEIVASYNFNDTDEAIYWFNNGSGSNQYTYLIKEMPNNNF